MNKAIPKVVDTLIVTEVSTETGEVKTYEKDVYKALETERCIDYSKKRDELSMMIDNEFGNYFFYFYDKMGEIDIPINMKARFLYLCTFVAYNGYLVSKWEKDMRYLTPLTRKDLADKLMLSDREFKSTIKTLVDCGLLVIDNKYYKVNEDIIVRGETKQRKGYTRVFLDGVRELYEACKPVQHKQLYYMFMILPFVNLQHNVLCCDIEEQMYQNIKSVSIKDMCVICGYNPHDYSKFMKSVLKFKIKGKDVFMVCYRGVGNFIMINPSIYYAGTRVEDLKVLMGQFGYLLSDN